MHKADVFGETAFLWNGDVLLSETRRHWQKLYVYEPDSFRPLALVQNQRVYYYHLDHLGTPQELTDVEGQVVWNVRYRAYGNVVEKAVEPVENNLRFQGQYFDAETGLHYNRFRYYDPQTGQFVQQDPIGLVGGENLYLYVPNPTGWVNPMGLTKDCSQLKEMSLEEAKDLLSRWDKATYRTIADSIRDHATRHSFGDDIAKYMRKAASFNKKGARKKILEDGATRWTRKSGEFLIERNGKIVAYGINT